MSSLHTDRAEASAVTSQSTKVWRYLLPRRGSSMTVLGDAYLRFVNETVKPTHFTTLTYRHPRRGTSFVTHDVAVRSGRSFLRSLARSESGHVWYAWGMGLHRTGVPHHHLLLGLSTPNPEAVIARAWRLAHPLAGHVLTRAYIADRGAAPYTLQHERWEVNVACPRIRSRCRRTHCAMAPSPWDH